MASSETDSWQVRRSPWPLSDVNHPSTTQIRRSSGVSPPRQRIASHLPTSRTYIDDPQPSPPYFSVPRKASIGQGLNRANKQHQLDPTTGSFLSSAQQVHGPGSYVGLGRYAETEAQRLSNVTTNGWGDSSVVQSPTEERRSVGNSDYMGSSSVANSQNGSLPPSRHGADSAQYAYSVESFGRFPQPNLTSANRSHTASLSSQHDGGAFGDRMDSGPTELVTGFGRLGMNDSSDSNLTLHKPSMSANAVSGYTGHGVQENGHFRQSVSGISPFVHQSSGGRAAKVGFLHSRRLSDRTGARSIRHLSQRAARREGSNDSRQQRIPPKPVLLDRRDAAPCSMPSPHLVQIIRRGCSRTATRPCSRGSCAVCSRSSKAWCTRRSSKSWPRPGPGTSSTLMRTASRTGCRSTVSPSPIRCSPCRPSCLRWSRLRRRGITIRVIAFGALCWRTSS